MAYFLKDPKNRPIKRRGKVAPHGTFIALICKKIIQKSSII